jgi:Ca-activated chloride channel family protein
MIAFVHFAQPWLGLLAVPLVVLVALAWHRRPPTLQVASALPFRHRPGGGSWLRQGLVRVPLLLEALGALLFIVALTRPQQGTEQTIRRAEGIDLMLAIDISGSMEAYDFGDEQPNQRELQRRVDAGLNRLAVAREQIKHFIAQRPNDRLGLLAFASRTYTLCPPTLDHDFLIQRLGLLQPGMLEERNTNLAAPLATATLRLKDSAAKRRVVVLFTDGANTVTDRISPREAAAFAAKFDLIIHTVGIGSGNAIAVVGTPFGPQAVRQTDSFDEPLMRELAQTTGGTYFAARDEAGFAAAMAAIDALEKSSVEQQTWVDYRELFPAWVLAGLACLALGLALEQTAFLRVP